MNFKPGAWLKRGVIAGVGGAALALVLVGVGTASADETGKYCVVKSPEGKCLVYGTRPVTWGGAGQDNFLAAPEAPITLTPVDDYMLSPNYVPYYCSNVSGYVALTGYNCYGYAVASIYGCSPIATAYSYTCYYNGVANSYANLPPATYAVVAATADALGADRSYVYSLLANGNSLDRVTDIFGVADSVFLPNFYAKLDARINELLPLGVMQPWQAAALEANAHSSWFITQPNLLQSLAQY